MLGRATLLAALSLWAAAASVQTVQAQTCAAQSKQNCINHVANALNCNYNFTNSVCAPPPTTDVCQSKSTASTCANAGCYWDASIANCLKSLSQINSVYNCAYWTSQSNCQSHGCAYDVVTSPVCQDVTTQGANSDNKTSSVISTQTMFSTPQLTSSLIFTVNVTVPFAYSTATRVSPKFPVLQVLPSLPSSLIPGALRNASEQTTVCSTFQAASYAEPVPNPPSGQSDAAVQALIESSIASTGVLTPAVSANRALLLSQFGSPRSDTIVKLVTYDTLNKAITHQVSVNLTQALQACGSARGVSAVTTSTGVTYTLPISYVEHGVSGSFVQASKLFTIAVTTTGQVSIGATAQYHYEATSVEVTYPQDTCPAGSAVQRISQTIVISDVFDPSVIVSPVSASNIVQKPAGSPAFPALNCYGDVVTAYNFLGCNRALFQCSYSFTTQGRCRVLGDVNGLTFANCVSPTTAERITDLGAPGAYPVSYDGLHRTFVYHKACIGASCTNTSQSISGTPDEIRTLVQTPVFAATSLTSNPFQVQGGFLPVPTADATQFRQLTDQAATPLGVNTFDGNVFSKLPVTIGVFMPAAQRSDFDLRLLIGSSNITVYPLDSTGARALSSSPASLDFADIRNSLLYTTKNAIAQCAPGDVCNNIPACSGILGCDGFSIPVSQLIALMPANGYGFSVAYRVLLPGVPNTGSLVSRRRLLQTAQDQPTDGNVYFRIRVNLDGSFTIEQISTLSHKSTAAEAFAMTFAIVALTSAVVYLFTASAQLSCAKSHSRGRK
jgi:hypothetical protein